ncbi:alpha/beta hydrolase [Vagococcus sp. DIV0080]|uniref:Alpha/beta hydrolase n=1 Tax=Candidatus Vagococcus giribetii TaxID=2230876 RepID=A0ABS3HRF1_9ENTE|nr:alpha/beta hydrolase [Vagococcus sp. DIV0080]MBO0476201.1 alpha/beta hydrolase [Vagococcus sp. DIV0080]
MKKIVSTADGSHIFYRTIGQGPPLFFIHGNSGSHGYFKKQIDFFKDRFQLILMDTRDHGYSGNKKEHLSFEQIVSDMNVILTHEKIEHISLFGFSDGANIALTFASQFQQKVSQMILVSPNITFNQLKPMQQFISNKLHWAAKYILRSKKKERVLQLAREDLPISEDKMNSLMIPTLVVIGDHDIVSPDKMASFVKHLPLGNLSVIKRCGHSVPRIKATELNQLSLDFLEKHNN